jgi:hypothetical protein
MRSKVHRGLRPNDRWGMCAKEASHGNLSLRSEIQLSPFIEKTECPVDQAGPRTVRFESRMGM